MTHVLRAIIGRSDGLASLREVSRKDAVSYVETGYFGGTGSQAAALYRAGRLEWTASIGICHPLDDRPPIRPINEALRALVVDAGSSFDEFEAVGLGRHRSTEEWARSQP